MRGDDVLRQLREADPAPPERVRGAAKGAAAQDTLEGILGRPRAEQVPRPPRRALLGIAASVVTILVAVAVTMIQQPADVELPTVRVALSEAAETAERVEAALPGPGRFLYSRTDVIEAFISTGPEGQWTALVPVRRESWIAADGSGRLREVPGRPIFPGPRDRQRWRASGSPRLQGPASDRMVGPGTFAPAVHTGASPTVERLRSTLLATDGASELPANQHLFVAASDLLSNPLAEPTLRSVLYRVLAGLDQVELLGTVQDPTGRPGIGVAIPSRLSGGLARRVLIFDEATSEVLAEQVVLLEAVEWVDADPPVVIESRTFGSSAIVASDQVRPGA